MEFWRRAFKVTMIVLTFVALVIARYPVASGAETDTINWDAIVAQDADDSADVPEAEQLPASVVEAVAQAVDWSEIVTKAIVWALGIVGTVLSALLGWACKKYTIPWLRDTVIPWLSQKKLLNAAQMAVEFAEAAIGRSNGRIKWDVAEGMLKDLGYDINSAEVVAAAKAAWQKLDIAQYAAGIKKLIGDEIPKAPEEEKPPDIEPERSIE